MHASIHTYIHAYIHSQTHLLTYIHTYMHTYIHTYLPTYIHTYIHTGRDARRCAHTDTDRGYNQGPDTEHFLRTRSYRPDRALDVFQSHQRLIRGPLHVVGVPPSCRRQREAGSIPLAGSVQRLLVALSGRLWHDLGGVGSTGGGGCYQDRAWHTPQMQETRDAFSQQGFVVDKELSMTPTMGRSGRARAAARAASALPRCERRAARCEMHAVQGGVHLGYLRPWRWRCRSRPHKWC